MTQRHPLHVTVLAAVAVGGAAGALLRFALSSAFPDDTIGFPWTIFLVNVTGCFVLALLPAFAVVRRRPLLAPLLGTGAMGGYTTLSTYAEQTRALVAAGRTTTAGVYVVGTLAACLVAVVVAGRLSSPEAEESFVEDEGDL